ncbi:MAG TPA: tetratricopeptide repeat protein, partial [Rhizomicrobium sp.]|nr:tetratricopeptide repeat protein [Rhizomicrobium sp.]
MLQTSVNGIAVSSATTDLWSVAAPTDSMTREMPWLSADESMKAAALPAPAAEARARAVLKANSSDPRARLLLAETLVRQNRWGEARAMFEALSQSQPQTEAVWRGLGQILARNGEKARAVEAFERSLDLAICGRDAWFALGSLLRFPGSEKH